MNVHLSIAKQFLQRIYYFVFNCFTARPSLTNDFYKGVLDPLRQIKTALNGEKLI